jgi:hypothetical protein
LSGAGARRLHARVTIGEAVELSHSDSKAAAHVFATLKASEVSIHQVDARDE